MVGLRLRRCALPGAPYPNHSENPQKDLVGLRLFMFGITVLAKPAACLCRVLRFLLYAIR